MTAATAAPPARRAPRGSRAVPVTAARLLRIELRRNAMPWALPLIAALFWFDSYRHGTGPPTPPLWVLQTFWNMGQGHTIIDFGPFVAGVAAWMGSRDGRRGTADLVTAAARPRWAAQAVTWAATAIWAVAAYLAFVGVMFAAYARQGLGGTPPWWWVAAGAVAVLAFSAAGFTLGACWPSRFAAPVAAFGGFLAVLASSKGGLGHASGWALLLPTNASGNYQAVSGIFYPYLPDLPIARMILLAGIALAALGVLGLPARAGGPWLRRAAAMVTVAGVAAAGTAVGLADTARLTPQGMVIPALHDAADDRPIAYTPVCGRVAGVAVCVNPAYRRYLAEVAADLRPVLAEMAGLPGAPARVAQVAGQYASGIFEGQAASDTACLQNTAACGPGGPDAGVSVPVTISGRPPVLSLPLGAFNTLPGAVPGSAAGFDQELALLSVHAFVAPGNSVGTAAQQAVQFALLAHGGIPFAQLPGALSALGLPPWAGKDFLGMIPASETTVGPSSELGGPVYATARRFAALPPAARHAWLAAHLSALRGGQLTLAQLP
jgi:hypothetical protein